MSPSCERRTARAARNTPAQAGRVSDAPAQAGRVSDAPAQAGRVSDAKGSRWPRGYLPSSSRASAAMPSGVMPQEASSSLTS